MLLQTFCFYYNLYNNEHLRNFLQDKINYITNWACYTRISMHYLHLGQPDNGKQTLSDNTKLMLIELFTNHVIVICYLRVT